jgi:hypothetical protein
MSCRNKRGHFNRKTLEFDKKSDDGKNIIAELDVARPRCAGEAARRIIDEYIHFYKVPVQLASRPFSFFVYLNGFSPW